MQDQAVGTTMRTGFIPLLAGTGAGIVAAAASVAVQLLMGVRYPEPAETAWSAFAAGIAGGLLYSILTRISARPVRALWAISLAIATLDSAMVAFLPMPAGHGLRLGIPVEGLIVPVRQLAALVGMGHFGVRHFPTALLPADTVIHYIPAVAVALLVPKLMGSRQA